MMIYIHRFPARPSGDLSVLGPFGSKLLFCVHDFVQFSVRGDSKLMFILSTRNAINTVVLIKLAFNGGERMQTTSKVRKQAISDV